MTVEGSDLSPCRLKGIVLNRSRLVRWDRQKIPQSGQFQNAGVPEIQPLFFEHKRVSDFVMQPLLLLCECDHDEDDTQNQKRKNL